MITKLLIASIFVMGPLDDASILSHEPIRYISMDWPEGKASCEQTAEHFNAIAVDMYGDTLTAPVAFCVTSDRDSDKLLSDVRWMRK